MIYGDVEILSSVMIRALFIFDLDLLYDDGNSCLISIF